MSDRLRDLLAEHQAVAAMTGEQLLPRVDEVAGLIWSAVNDGGRLVTFGNGGSAADAQHFAAELLGHFRREREPLPALALTTDSSTLTAVANDYDFSEVFARQVRALVSPADVVVGITTSGRSENVVRGLRAAAERGAHTVALTGGDGGAAAELASFSLVVPSGSTARVQEMHILIIHLISERLDDWAAD